MTENITDEEIIAIKNEILKDIDHNKPVMGDCLGNQGFLEALTIGADRFSNSELKKLIQEKF